MKQQFSNEPQALKELNQTPAGMQAKKEKHKFLSSKKLSYQKMGIFFLLVISALLLSFVLLMRLNQQVNDGSIQVNLDSLSTGKLSFPLSKEESLEYYPISDQLLFHAGKTRSALITPTGEEEISFELGFNQLILQENQNYFSIIEKNSPRYFVFSKKNLLYEGKSDYAILSAKVSKQGQLALLLDHPQRKGYVQVFHSDGSLALEINIQDGKQSGYILDVQFNEKGNRLYLIMENLHSSSPFPVLVAYSLEEDTLGKVLAQYRPQDAHLLARVDSIVDGQIYAWSSKSAYFIEDEKISPLLTYANLYSAGISSDSAFLIANEQEGGKFYLKVWPLSQTENLSFDDALPLPSVPAAWDFHGNYLALLFGNEIHIYSLHNPSSFKTIALSSPVRQMRVTENGVLLLVCEDGIHEVQN